MGFLETAREIFPKAMIFTRGNRVIVQKQYRKDISGELYFRGEGLTDLLRETARLSIRCFEENESNIRFLFDLKNGEYDPKVAVMENPGEIETFDFRHLTPEEIAIEIKKRGWEIQPYKLSEDFDPDDPVSALQEAEKIIKRGNAPKKIAIAEQIKRWKKLREIASCVDFPFEQYIYDPEPTEWESTGQFILEEDFDEDFKWELQGKTIEDFANLYGFSDSLMISFGFEKDGGGNIEFTFTVEVYND